MNYYHYIIIFFYSGRVKIFIIWFIFFLRYGSVKHRLEQATSKHVFVKDMGFCVPKDGLQYLPLGYKHTFLIRNPLRTIYSYRKSITDDRYFVQGCFVKEQYDLWMHVKENLDSNPVVIDADDLLTKPKETLSAYCAAVGLPYTAIVSCSGMLPQTSLRR